MLPVFLVPFIIGIRGLCPVLSNVCDTDSYNTTNAEPFGFHVAGEHNVTVIGDSIVVGEGDGEAQRGFVGRLRARFPSFQINEISQPGITSWEMFDLLASRLSAPACDPAKEALVRSDTIVIAVGTNDIWSGNAPVSTVRQIRDIAELLRGYLRARGLFDFSISAATLISANSEHEKWLRQVNILLRANTIVGLKTDISFEPLRETSLSPDKVHPTSHGYEILADTVSYYFVTHLKPSARAVSCRIPVIAESLSSRLLFISQKITAQNVAAPH